MSNKIIFSTLWRQCIVPHLFSNTVRLILPSNKKINQHITVTVLQKLILSCQLSITYVYDCQSSVCRERGRQAFSLHISTHNAYTHTHWLIIYITYTRSDVNEPPVHMYTAAFANTSIHARNKTNTANTRTREKECGDDRTMFHSRPLSVVKVQMRMSS